MHRVIKRALDGRYQYCFTAGPNVVHDWHDAARYGLNCGALVHLMYRDVIGIQLPTRLMCLELFHNKQHFRAVKLGEGWNFGDIAFFGGRDQELTSSSYLRPLKPVGTTSDPESQSKLHLAFCVENSATGTDPKFIHAIKFRDQDGICIWKLSDFQATATYAMLQGVRRLRSSIYTAPK